MSILVVGSVALDSVQTPFGERDRVLGGSATYFSTSASFFTDVNLVAVVGEDFPEEHTRFLTSRNIDLTGLSRVPGKTFHWKGRYGYDLNEAQTLETHLNVFESFKPVIPESWADAQYLILANIDPELQMEVLNQVKKPRVVACDTMNFWISSKIEALKKVISRVDFLIINEGEARQLSGEANLVKAARSIIALGVKNLIVKRGEYGVLMFNGHSVFAAPAYPLEEVFDPTGAGDTFAGGFMGYLANTGNLSDEGVRQAIIFGSVMASFNVEAFSLDRLKTLTYPEIEARYRSFKNMTHFQGVGGL
ncbi:bifunctional hydroxymethylpyrimidine kinase/phosphomethylpyrimidine kinase [Geomonas nitrogeniifigens]|uniref:Bifunctional hydroxymethylpyrimidine kinase/phosphomethylpyrimidine kinase n=1 Tax=Geomonas diazotrophica TaxID=2843197 RepID=A0ABX8JBW9_9BACT|nr:PfkB family carbohydrate kinase [Geomonas nitrogeniifigens]QWV95918.1 bifunctional hydroxymethylpyrimidine kinase/phosphomethylpyrimidine kinase [Geomonas nitrogeniifigens]QXE85004.1 bifunctional hydroxymethylpyrimidine kinase/phosphomethylpyrimidine kinase [Geomonas nitrogeniifigens]